MHVVIIFFILFVKKCQTRLWMAYQQQHSQT